MIRAFIFICIFQGIIYNKVYAVEPPRDTVVEALAKGESAFLARVHKLVQLERMKDEVIALASMKIHFCIYGKNCIKNNLIKMKYNAQSIKSNTFPIQFPIGKEILFILNSDSKKIDKFDSDWVGGIDKAFVCDNFPNDFQTSTSEVRCFSIYGGNKSFWISWDDVLKYTHIKTN